MNHGIQAMILAGGFGTRLRGVIDDLPKVLAPVCGRPFIFQLLEQLNRFEFKDVILCTGYMSEMVEKTVGGAYARMQIHYSAEDHPLDTAGAVRQALSLTTSEYVLVMNGDSYIDVDLLSFVEWYMTNQASSSLVLKEMPNTERFGRVMLSDDQFVISFKEKGGHSGAGWINAGVYIFKRDILQAVIPDEKVSIERDLLPTLAGKELRAFLTTGAFIDIGTPESYSKAEEFFSKVSL